MTDRLDARRLHQLPPLFWLFVALAVADVGARAGDLPNVVENGFGLAALGFVARLVSEAALVLLPAAVLWAPGPANPDRRLLGGALLVAANPIAMLVADEAERLAGSSPDGPGYLAVVSLAGSLATAAGWLAIAWWVRRRHPVLARAGLALLVTAVGVLVVALDGVLSLVAASNLGPSPDLVGYGGSAAAASLALLAFAILAGVLVGSSGDVDQPGLTTAALGASLVVAGGLILALASVASMVTGGDVGLGGAFAIAAVGSALGLVALLAWLAAGRSGTDVSTVGAASAFG